MSEVSARTPKRQAIVERLRQRIDSFRSWQARHKNKTQPSPELKSEEETRFIKTRILENEIKWNAETRPDQDDKIAKPEEITNVVGPEKAASNTGLQPNAKRRAEFPSAQMDGERSLQSSDDLTAPVSPKYRRFENPNDVHCNVKPQNFKGEPSSLPEGKNPIFPHPKFSKGLKPIKLDPLPSDQVPPFREEHEQFSHASGNWISLDCQVIRRRLDENLEQKNILPKSAVTTGYGIGYAKNGGNLYEEMKK